MAAAPSSLPQQLCVLSIHLKNYYSTRCSTSRLRSTAASSEARSDATMTLSHSLSSPTACEIVSSTRHLDMAGSLVSRQDGQDMLKERLHLLLSSRQFPKTICPSEVARSFSQAELNCLAIQEWRQLMEPIRHLVWQLRDQGDIQILQHGDPLEPGVGLQDVRGPIRIRYSPP